MDAFLLVETSCHPVINHSNAVMGKTIARAKNLRIAWFGGDFNDEVLLHSYSPNSQFIGFKKFPLFIRLSLFCIAAFYYMGYVLLVDRIRSFKYKGIPYGDFIYDSYLSMFSMATLHRLDARIIKVFYILLLRDREARFILSRYNIKAVLVSNYIGLLAGPLFRVALQNKLHTFIKSGGHAVITLSLYNNLSQIYDYPLRPTLDELRVLSAASPELVEKDFNEFIDEAAAGFYGAFIVAYNNVLESDITKESFLKTMGLEDKPPVFVMLHAFNDYPLSHFKNMLFKDYYDWFMQTYRFALKDKTKNWIFKEHPANDSYPTRDLDLNKVFKRLPSHIRFISYKSKIKASAVLNVADLIVTCLGTAGVEMPALKGIPSLIGGDTFFDGFGFTIDPKSKEAYFKTLRDFSKKRRLNGEQRIMAKCCYLYVKKYTSVPFAAGPQFTYGESRDLPRLQESYPARILGVYKTDAELIYKQFYEYAEKISRPNFRRLLSIDIDTKSGVSSNPIAETASSVGLIKKACNYLVLKKRMFIGMAGCFLKNYNLYNFKFQFREPTLKSDNSHEIPIRNKPVSFNDKLEYLCKAYLEARYYKLDEKERRRFLINYIWGARPGEKWHHEVEPFYLEYAEFAGGRKHLIDGILALKAEDYEAVVEIGTGNGWFLSVLSKRIDRNINFIGLDLNKQVIERTKYNYRDNKNLDFICADIQAFARNKSIAKKMVISCAVLEYFSLEELSDFCRLLKQNAPCYLAIFERVSKDNEGHDGSCPIGDFSYSHDYASIFKKSGLRELYSHKQIRGDNPDYFNLSAIYKTDMSGGVGNG